MEMNLRQIKNDLKASLQTENYFAETEFYRLLNDESITHKSKVELLSKQLEILTNTINGQRLVDALLPEKPAETPQADQEPIKGEEGAEPPIE